MGRSDRQCLADYARSFLSAAGLMGLLFRALPVSISDGLFSGTPGRTQRNSVSFNQRECNNATSLREASSRAAPRSFPWSRSGHGCGGWRMGDLQQWATTTALSAVRNGLQKYYPLIGVQTDKRARLIDDAAFYRNPHSFWPSWRLS